MSTARALHLAVLLAPGPDGATRRRTFALVSQFPGLHQNEIARRLEVTAPAAEHHLRHLARAGLITVDNEAGRSTYFPTVQSPAGTRAIAPLDRKKVALFRQQRPLQILGFLLLHGHQTMQELRVALEVAASTCTYYVSKLENAGLVKRTASGRSRSVHLVDRDQLVTLLLDYEPPQDMLSGFEDLWGDLGLT